MQTIEIAFELIARYLGIGDPSGRSELRVLLDLYADAVDMEARTEPENEPAPHLTEPVTLSGSDDAIPVAADTSAAPKVGNGLIGTAPSVPEAETPPPAPSAYPQPMPPKTGGPGALLKKTTWLRLKDYRQSNGLGCFSALADADTTGKLTRDIIASMYAGDPYSLPAWEALSSALDAVCL